MGYEKLRQRLTSKNIFLFGLLSVFIVVISLLVGRPKPFNYQDDWDFFTFWEAPYLLLQGKDAYDASDWVQVHQQYGFPPANPTYLYPLPLAILMLPLGLLPPLTAAVLWTALSLVAILFSIQLILSYLRAYLPMSYLLPVLCGIFFFRPVAVTIYINQLDGFILLGLVVGVLLWMRGKSFLGGILIALSVLKPQLGVPVMGLMGLWQLHQRQWKAIAGEVLGLGLLFGLGMLFDSAWLLRWLTIGGNKVSQNFYSTPTLWGLSSMICRPSLDCVRWLGAILALLGIGLIAWILLRKNNHDALYSLSVVSVGALLVSPYLWVYSQTLLVLPVLMITAEMYRRNAPYLLTATFPLLAALFSFSMVGISTLVGADIPSVLVPLVILVLLHFLYRPESNLPASG